MASSLLANSCYAQSKQSSLIFYYCLQAHSTSLYYHSRNASFRAHRPSSLRLSPLKSAPEITLAKQITVIIYKVIFVDIIAVVVMHFAFAAPRADKRLDFYFCSFTN